MRETIVFAPGLNANEMMKNLALHDVKCFNLRICNDVQLAQLALMRSGISGKASPVGNMEEFAVMMRALQCTDYFGTVTFSDVQQITSAIRNMRMLVADADEQSVVKQALEKGVFQEKNKALYMVYAEYMRIMKEEALIDRVGIIRLALTACAPVDADFYVLEEFPLNPLQQALVDRLSDGTVKKVSMPKLYQRDKKSIQIQDIRNCYGMANEVESVLQEIYENKRLDACTLALTDYPAYSQLLYDYAVVHKIPITFGKGISIINSEPATLLRLYYHWATDSFFDATSVVAMVKDRSFDKQKLNERFDGVPDAFRWERFCRLLGAIRFTNNPNTNQKRIDDFEKALQEEERMLAPNDRNKNELQFKQLCLPYLKIMAEELALPAEEFIAKYAYIRHGFSEDEQDIYAKMDMEAVRVIYNDLKTVAAANSSPADVITSILSKAICRESSRAGAMHVTDIPGALSCVRDNLFILGLAASKYPGTPKENYLLLDEDIACFGEAAKQMLSGEKVLQKRNRLIWLAQLAATLSSKLYLSYAGLDVSELKHDTASSVLYDLFWEANGGQDSAEALDKATRKVAYFEPCISSTRQVGNAYNLGKQIKYTSIEHNIVNSGTLEGCENREYSPTALADFVKCPRLFVLKHLLGITDESANSAFQVISALNSGTLIHELMRKLSNSNMSEAEFLKLAEQLFDRFVKEHPPVVNQSADNAKKQFLNMAKLAYRKKPTSVVVLEEQDISCVHENGIRLHGIPDCVERKPDGSYHVIDYKTNSMLVHMQNNVNTCMQLVAYAYILEKNGYTVSGGEYRYLQLDEDVPCIYNDAIKRAFNEKMNEFQDYLKHISERAEEKTEIEACYKCRYAAFCERK